MPTIIKLSELVEQIQDTIEARFSGETFWITAEITDVRKQEGTRRCYLKLIEKHNNDITTEIRGVFWANYYNQIENFEKVTGQIFANGIEITCNVRVRFHPRYGLNVDVLQIDLTYALGKLEMEKQLTLERLTKENPKAIQLINGQYITYNNRLELPIVIQRIALITAMNSDGQRDFKQEVEKNKHGYAFPIKEYLVQIQGDDASKYILQQLKQIESSSNDFDVVVIVRGGGSQTDFKPFDDYDLSKRVALFPIPILAGIGHDRNTSIVDLMARQYKTPTKVGAFIVENNFEFENAIIDFKERFLAGANELLEQARDNLDEIRRIVKSYNPSTVLKKGFAIITQKGKLIIDPKELKTNSEIETILKTEKIISTITQKRKNESKLDF